MTTKIKTYVAIGAALLFIVTGYSLWSNHKIKKLETAAENAKRYADVQEQRAYELEMSARKFEEKIAYLEANLGELRSLARKQDEELKDIETTTGNARRDVERSRSIRTAASTADEVCRKLAELGHACQ